MIRRQYLTYIPMAKGFLYLVAVMDWASRRVLSWRLSNTMDAEFCVDALEEALVRHGRPEIFNSERQRATGSSAGASSRQPVHQRRLHRPARGARRRHQHGRQGPVPQQYLHRAAVAQPQVRGGLHQATVAEARAGIGGWLILYNDERPHQALGYRTPREVFEAGAALWIDRLRRTAALPPCFPWTLMPREASGETRGNAPLRVWSQSK